MPPLAFAVPVITRSEHPGDAGYEKVKSSKALASKPRTYGDGPLPVKPSSSAPKQARIVNRNVETYHLRIGDVDIHDVGIEEILDYVSPLELEEFENREFVRERSVLNVLEAERETLKREKLERQRERAKRKGVVLFEDIDSTDEVTEDAEVAVGKHGRARPTYTHLFKKPKERRKWKRDFDTDEQMSLSENDDEGVSTENEPVLQTAASRPLARLSEMPKRRRRKRDKVTGDLLPLSPAAQQPAEAEKRLDQKRQRRRRHPQTGELMPIGWRYDPENAGDTYEKRREGVGSHSFRQLSISEEPIVKRQRLDIASSVSRSPSPIPSKAQLATHYTPVKALTDTALKHPQTGKVVVDLLSSDNDLVDEPVARTPSNLKSPPKPATGTPKPIQKRPMLSTAISSAPKSSLELENRTSLLQRFASKLTSPRKAEVARTSIVNPSFGHTSSTDPLADPVEDEDESEDSDLDDGEWFIEAILDHRQSDPNTHPAELGKEPVMLYLVKWEGFDEPTWEPIESFGDRKIVMDYRRQVGLDSEPEDVKMAVTTSTNPSVHPSMTAPVTTVERDDGEEGEEDQDMDEDEFEIETILAHHFSDPRTHPAELGRTPVVLYKVKWKGWEEPTWEPASSFEDKDVLQQYHDRIGR